MEPVSTVAFIGLAIIAVTEAIKQVAPGVNGAVTIVVSVLVGIVIALIDGLLGLPDITIAEGIMAALSASGVVTVAKKV